MKKIVFSFFLISLGSSFLLAGRFSLLSKFKRPKKITTLWDDSLSEKELLVATPKRIKEMLPALIQRFYKNGHQKDYNLICFIIDQSKFSCCDILKMILSEKSKGRGVLLSSWNKVLAKIKSHPQMRQCLLCSAFFGDVKSVLNITEYQTDLTSEKIKDSLLTAMEGFKSGFYLTLEDLEDVCEELIEHEKLSDVDFMPCYAVAKTNNVLFQIFKKYNEQ